MAKIRKEPSGPKIRSTILIQGESALNRFRNLIIKFDSIPADSAIIPPSVSGLDVIKLQEIWVFGLQIESIVDEPNKVHAYTKYAEALMRAAYDITLEEKIEEVVNPTTIVSPGKFTLVSQGIGEPDQVRLVGPFSEEQQKKFSNPKVFQEFIRLITPVSHLTLSQVRPPEILGTINDIEALSLYATPHSVEDYLLDYTSGLLTRLGEKTLRLLEKNKGSISEIERANGRLALMQAKASLAAGLKALRL